MDWGKLRRNKKAALDFHEFPKPGKLEIRATKPLANQSDLAKAYSPGVAEACLEIKKTVFSFFQFLCFRSFQLLSCC